MRAFAVRLAVDTPVSLRHLLHLDALLGNVAARLGRAHDDLPLERSEGLWHASAALMETTVFGVAEEACKRVAALRRDSIPAGLLDGLPKAERSIDAMSPHRPRLNEYPSLRGATALWFSGRGEPGAVLDLLSEVTGLGAMAGTGHGRVTGMELVETDDAPLAGIALSDGGPARAVPAARWLALGFAKPDRALVAAQRWYGPYWERSSDLCLSPMQTDLTGSQSEIRKLVGA